LWRGDLHLAQRQTWVIRSCFGKISLDKLYELKSKDFVSIKGESGGLWVDGKGRPTLHNNWGSSDADGNVIFRSRATK
jgi:hypothetical protein